MTLEDLAALSENLGEDNGVLSGQAEREEQERLEKREKRAKCCGKPGFAINIKDGTIYEFNMTCELPKLCPYCFARRVAYFEARIEKAKQDCGEWLRVFQGSAAEIAKIVRKLRRVGCLYLRVPTLEGAVIIYDSFGAQEIAGNLKLEDLNWKDLADTPEHKRYSGDLGRLEGEGKEEEKAGIVVQIEQIVPDWETISIEDVRSAVQRTIARTKGFQPIYHKESIEIACNTRMGILKENIVKLGGKIALATSRKVRVGEGGIGEWNKADNPSSLPTKRQQEKAEKKAKKEIEARKMKFEPDLPADYHRYFVY